MRVLILDDDPFTAFKLARMFAIRGISVVSVSTAAAARRTIERERFEAVLVDAQADQAKGLRVLAEARRRDADISLFLLSDRDPEPGLADADIYYIAKPWNGLLVVDIVRARSRREREPASASGPARDPPRDPARDPDERPTVDIRPMRKERRPGRDSASAPAVGGVRGAAGGGKRAL